MRSLIRFLFALVTAAALALSVAACQTSDGTGGLTPVIVDPPVKTDPPITGTLGVNAQQAYNFVVSNVGPLTIALTSAGPPAGVAMNLQIGQLTLAGCQPATSAVNITPGPVPQISFPNVNAGAYCLIVANVNATTPVTFSITITHT